MLRFIYDHRLHQALPIEKTPEMITYSITIPEENHARLEGICFMSLLAIGVFLYSPVMMMLLIPIIFIIGFILWSCLSCDSWLHLLGHLVSIIINMEEGFSGSIIRNELDLPESWPEDVSAYSTTSECSWTERYIQKCLQDYMNCFCDHPYDIRVGFIDIYGHLWKFFFSLFWELFMPN
jgi:hypothetical protein